MMKQAVKFAAEEDERSKRLIFFGIEDGGEDEEEDKIDPNAAVLALGIEPMFESSTKLGSRKPRHNRPVFVTSRDAASITEILKKSHLLRHIEAFKSVHILPDRGTRIYASLSGTGR